MIARNEQLERFDGKFVAMNRKYKDHSKYNRKEAKRELRRDLRGSYCIGMSVVRCNINPNYCGTLFFAIWYKLAKSINQNIGVR